MLTLVFCGAEKAAAHHDAFAAGQMDAAAQAPLHAFAGISRCCFILPLPLPFPAQPPQQAQCRYHRKRKKYDFGHDSPATACPESGYRSSPDALRIHGKCLKEP